MNDAISYKLKWGGIRLIHSIIGGMNRPVSQYDIGVEYIDETWWIKFPEPMEWYADQRGIESYLKEAHPLLEK